MEARATTANMRFAKMAGDVVLENFLHLTKFVLCDRFVLSIRHIRKPQLVTCKHKNPSTLTTDNTSMEQYDLTSENVYEVLCQTLPKKNDFSASDYLEELQELVRFGITTKLQLLDLIVKHRDQALTIDEEPLDGFHVKHYKSEYGEEYVEDRIRHKYWFAYPALLRIILELEFGEKYIEFANNRDNI